MEVLESITNYIENIGGKGYTSEKEALEMLYNYCHRTSPQLTLGEVDWDFFDEFIMCWLPKNQNRLKQNEISSILQGVGAYYKYIQETYNTLRSSQYRDMNQYKKECLRIYQLRYVFSKYLGDPILSVEPCVIDFKAYKKYKARKGFKEKNGIYQQGLFQVIEIDYDNTVIIRKLSKGTCVRILLQDSLLIYMKKGDILHLRIKQRQFFSCWEVEDLTHCYLPNASEYLMN